jgi:DNA-binding XRE family transcriptional regulator
LKILKIIYKVMKMTPLAKAIKEKGLRKKWVAEKVGIAPGTLSLILSGKSDPTLKVALRLAKVLNMTVEELWGHLIEEEENRPDQ